MRLVIVAGVLAACGPGLKGAGPHQSFAHIAHDAGAIEQMLYDTVTYGGLWFENADCAARFPKPGEIKSDAFPAFARCVAELGLQRSAREDALGDVMVMTYGPGFEVEVRVVNDAVGPRLRWIGFVSRRAAEELPTISSEALEGLRVTGDRHGPLDASVAGSLDRSRVQFTWLKLCIDEAGAVTSAHPYETTSVAASTAFTAVARTWTFRPFTVQGQPMPVCSMVRPAYPPNDAPAIETIPLPPPPSRARGAEPIVFALGAIPEYTAGKRVRGTTAVAPDDRTKVQIQQAGVSRLTGVFRLCLDDKGRVESVLPLRSTGFAAYDRKLLGAMLQWGYSPFLVDGAPVPVCTGISFVYTQR